MGYLSRSAPSLLRKVGGRKHATDDDHEVETPNPSNTATARRVWPERAAREPVAKQTTAEKSYPSPAITCSSGFSSSPLETIDLTMDNDIVDVDADPVSSGDELSAAQDGKKTPGVPEMKSWVREDDGSAGAETCLLTSSQSGQKESKSYLLSSENSPNEEPEWTDPAPKRRKLQSSATAYKSMFSSTTESSRRPKSTFGKPKTYGRTSLRAEAVSPKKSGFRRMKAEVEEVENIPEKSGFKHLRKSMPPERRAAQISGSWDDDGDLSPLSEPCEDVESKEIGVPIPEEYSIAIDCSFCGDEVGRLVHEEFVQRHSLPKQLPFKWQRRFCDHHKRETARQLWEERGYPDIDWAALERRMKKHDRFLTAILMNTKPSHYRDELKEKLMPGKKGLQQTLDNENAKLGAAVGYYGPKGEKIMVAYILNRMSDDIRRRAAHDRLIASAGTQGGIAGFVQGVLLPHLVELLVKEDMRLKGSDWSQRARVILAQSAESGDLLNPEAEDAIHELDADDD